METKKTTRAWLLLGLDITADPVRIQGIALSSERYPTQSFKFRLLSLLEGEGTTYQEGKEHIRAVVSGYESSHYKWIIPYLTERDRNFLFPSGEVAGAGSSQIGVSTTDPEEISTG